MKMNDNLAYPLSVEELKSILNGDPNKEENKNKLIEHSLRTVIQAASKYKSHGEMDELCQIGCIGLIKSLHNLTDIDETRFYYHVKSYAQNEIELYLERKLKR